jgi:hypothetical protein
MTVSKVPRARLTLRAALLLGHGRWPLARRLKVWKSPGGVEESPRPPPWRLRWAV